DIGLGVAQGLRNVDRLGRRFLALLRVELAEAVEGGTAQHGDAEVGHVGELDGVVRAGVDRLGDVDADLLRVDVERGDDLDVMDVVAAEDDVHQTRYFFVRRGVLVVLETLHERARAVANARDREADLRLGGHRDPPGSAGSCAVVLPASLSWVSLDSVSPDGDGLEISVSAIAASSSAINRSSQAMS